MLDEKYYISVYEPQLDRTLFFDEIKPNANGEIEANFIRDYWRAAAFDDLPDAQCFCKVLISNYVKRFVYQHSQAIDDSNRQYVEVQLCQTDSWKKKAEPFAIWGVSLLNNNEVIIT